METDLSFVTTEEMWKEIRKRCRAAVLLYQLEATDSDWAVAVEWSGGAAAGIGLMEYARYRLVRHMAGDDDDGPK